MFMVEIQIYVDSFHFATCLQVILIVLLSPLMSWVISQVNKGDLA